MSYFGLLGIGNGKTLGSIFCLMTWVSARRRTRHFICLYSSSPSFFPVVSMTSLWVWLIQSQKKFVHLAPVVLFCLQCVIGNVGRSKLSPLYTTERILGNVYFVWKCNFWYSTCIWVGSGSTLFLKEGDMNCQVYRVMGSEPERVRQQKTNYSLFSELFHMLRARELGTENLSFKPG
jgi:hypothetical protein